MTLQHIFGIWHTLIKKLKQICMNFVKRGGNTMQLKEKLNNPKKRLRELNKKIEYLSNGRNYVLINSDDDYMLVKQRKCHNCLHEIKSGYIVWSCINTSILCKDCFEAVKQLSLLSKEERIRQENNDNYIWYLCFFDREVRNYIKEKHLKILKKHFNHVIITSL